MTCGKVKEAGMGQVRSQAIMQPKASANSPGISGTRWGDPIADVPNFVKEEVSLFFFNFHLKAFFHWFLKGVRRGRDRNISLRDTD